MLIRAVWGRTVDPYGVVRVGRLLTWGRRRNAPPYEHVMPDMPDPVCPKCRQKAMFLRSHGRWQFLRCPSHGVITVPRQLPRKPVRRAKEGRDDSQM